MEGVNVKVEKAKKIGPNRNKNKIEKHWSRGET